MKGLIQQIESTGSFAPWCFLALFIVASLLMIWRLEAMNADGFEGTVLGTLIMPYCSGIGNLIFAFLLAKNHGPGAEVMTNALVNNVTNLTLLIGIPAILWQTTSSGGKGARGKSRKGDAGKAQTNRFSMLLTLLAVLFFTGAVWALGRDGSLNFNDGLVLVGLFLFWQCFHVFEVLKFNASTGKTFTWAVALNLALLGVGAYASYVSINWLVDWLNARPSGFISKDNLGWLTGWMMVLPNALLALYYGWRRKLEVVYTSQVGDGHICIPLCVGIYALFHPLEIPAAVFLTAIYLLAGATLLHIAFIATTGKLPRLAGIALVAAYGYFLKTGLLK